MNAILLEIILDTAENIFIEISSNQELKKSILAISQSTDDWLQLKLGNVSKRTLREAIELAVSTSNAKDEKTICEIIATISTLYACGQVERGANVGGTLLKKFGHNIFPHIRDKEIRFAKPINEAVYNSLMISTQEKFHEKMKSYNLKSLTADEIKNAASSVSSLGSFQGAANLIITHGLDLVKYLRAVIRL